MSYCDELFHRKPIARRTPLVLAALIVTAILAFSENWRSRKRICFIFDCESAGQHNQLALARLKARRGAVDDSIRYHKAIYGFWASNPNSNRRQTRFELIEFLLKQNGWPQAQAELLALFAGAGFGYRCDGRECLPFYCGLICGEDSRTRRCRHRLARGTWTAFGWRLTSLDDILVVRMTGDNALADDKPSSFQCFTREMNMPFNAQYRH